MGRGIARRSKSDASPARPAFVVWLLLAALLVPVSLIVGSAALPAAADAPPPGANDPGVEWLLDGPPDRNGHAVINHQREELLFTTNSGLARITFDGVRLPDIETGSTLRKALPVGDQLYLSTDTSFLIVNADTGTTASSHPRPEAHYVYQIAVAQGSIWFLHRSDNGPTRTGLGKMDLSTGAFTYDVITEGDHPTQENWRIFIGTDFLATNSNDELVLVDGRDAWTLDVSTNPPTTLLLEDVDSRVPMLSPDGLTMWIRNAEYRLSDLQATGRVAPVYELHAVGETKGLDTWPNVVSYDSSSVGKRLLVDGESVDPLAITDEAAFVTRYLGGATFVARLTLAPIVRNVTPDFHDPLFSDEVTITGEGFTGASSVRFGELEAVTFNVVDDSTIVANVPALAEGSHPIRVGGPSGTSPSFAFSAGAPSDKTPVYFSTVGYRDTDTSEVQVEVSCNDPHADPYAEQFRETLQMSTDDTVAHLFNPGSTCSYFVYSTQSPGWHEMGYLSADGTFSVVSDDSLLVEVGDQPIHVANQRSYENQYGSVRVATVVSGSPPAGLDVEVEARCAGQRNTNSYTLSANDYQNVSAHAECTIVMVDDGGAAAVVSAHIHRDDTTYGGTEVATYSSTAYGADYPLVIFYLIFEPEAYQYPIVIGSPGENVDGRTDAGTITVLPTTIDGLPIDGEATVLSQDSPGVPGASETGDGWGAAAATGDFNGDGYEDIAVGAPDENLGSIVDAGGVTVLYGGPGGPGSGGSAFFTQDTAGVPGAAEADDRFGAALTAVRWDTDAYADLVIGAPGENVGSIRDAGGVLILRGGPGGVTTDKATWLDQNSPRISGSAQRDAGFGSVLTADNRTLAIGVPLADLDSTVDTGAVHLVRAFLPWDTLVYGDLSPGAQFGASVHLNEPHLLVGAPYADVGAVPDAGSAVRFRLAENWEQGTYLSGSGTTTYTQNHSQMVDTPETGDRFGASVYISDQDFFLIGAPGQDLPGKVDAGIVHVMNGAIVHDAAGIPGASQAGDGFGTSLAPGQSTMLFGIPNRRVGSVNNAGAVVLLGLYADYAAMLTDASPGVNGQVEAGDGFGTTLAGLPDPQRFCTPRLPDICDAVLAASAN